MYQRSSYNHLPVFSELFCSTVFVTDSLTAHFNYPNQNSSLTKDKQAEGKGTVLTPVLLITLQERLCFVHMVMSFHTFCDYVSF